MEIAKKIIVIVARLILGGLFLVFGVNDLLLYAGANFFTPAPPESEAAQQFIGFIAGNYILPSIKLLEVISGAMILSGFFPALGLALSAGPVFGIFMFHATLAPEGMIIAIVVLLSQAVLTWTYWNSFRSLFEAKPQAL